jgi:hypothetical protein
VIFTVIPLTSFFPKLEPLTSLGQCEYPDT